MEVAGGIQPEPVVEAVPRRSSRWLLIAGSTAALLGAGFLIRSWLIPERPAWTPSPPTQLTRDAGLTTDPAISRDGKLLAYASDRGGSDNLDIWQHTSGGEPRRLVGHPSDDRQPDISPDGNELVFRSERDGGGIYSVSTLGGDPKLILKDAYYPRFSPDGTRIAYAAGSFGKFGFGVYTLSTGSNQMLAQNLLADGPAAWSPDGKSLLFAGASDYVKPRSILDFP